MRELCKADATEYMKYKVYFESLNPDHCYSRLGKPFKTKGRYYYYDTGTGKVLSCTGNRRGELHCQF
jgi:uncharacterized protein